MKKRKITVKSLAVVLAVLMMFTSIGPLSASAITFDSSKLGTNMYLTSRTNYTIAPGVTETHITTNNSTGTDQAQGFAMEVDLSNPTTSVLASYKDYDYSKGYGMQTVRDQAAACEAKTGANVVAGVNGDFFNMGTGAPTGTFVMAGSVCNVNEGWPYFAILKDGTAKIGDNATAAEIANFRECVGGPAVIMRNGVIDTSSGYGVDQLPRTAAGIKADGSVVFYVVDGRQQPTSCGMNFYQLAYVMKALGCVDAISLDGGGSSTFLSQHEGSDALVCRNSPCDGSERTVSSAILVCSSAAPTGEFDHATLSPNNEVYTPNSVVEFSANGVDAAGGAAPLPENGFFALADTSFGSIDEKGRFTSTGKTGTVTVNYISGGAVKGSTSIEIQNPDELVFTKEEINLAFDQESTLGLTAKWNARTVNIKDGDLVWSLDDVKMGTFNGNTFTASPDQSINGNIYVKSAVNDSVHASIAAVIGRQPYVVWDFEQPEYYTFATGYLNANGGIADYKTGDSSCNMLLGTYLNGDGTPRGAEGTAEVVDIDTGIVRMGSHSLKINYDFTNQGDDKIDGVCIGAYNPTSSMEGSPTAIGLWLYAPEGTPNFWFRIRVWDAGANQGEGAVLTLNFTPRCTGAEDGVGGINWQGWKYCEAELAGVGPFSLLGGECVRLMNCVNYSGNGNKTVTGGTNPDGTLASKYLPQAERKGCVYIDNVQFVYGSNTQDVDNPVVDKIEVGREAGDNLVNITSGTTVNTNKVCIKASFHDVQNKYTTGIDYANKAYGIYLDGKNITDTAICYNDDIIWAYPTLADGAHSVKLLLRDGFGNETTETRYFTVKGGTEYPTVTVTPSAGSCLLNSEFGIDISSNDIIKVMGITTTVMLDTDIIKSADDFNVTYSAGFAGTEIYNPETGELVITITRTQEAGGTPSDKIATITAKIPARVAAGKNFTYKVTEGIINYSDPTIVTDTFSTSEVATPIAGSYKVTSEPVLIGSEGTFYITDKDGAPASGVELYTAANELIGTSDANGIVKTSMFSASVQNYSVYAKSADKYSFVYTSQSFAGAGNANGTPTYIISTASDNSSVISKKLCWISNPTAASNAAFVEFAPKASYDVNGESAFTKIAGTSTLYTYTGSSAENNYAARMNCVQLTNLSENTEYAYRCGDGVRWSEVKTFKTIMKGTDTKFFIVGDIQAQDMTNTINVFNKIDTDGVAYTFGLQTGDAIETSNIYSLWEDVFKVFSSGKAQSTDMIHVYGNHELIGDSTGLSSKLAWGLNDSHEKYYSVVYGNVYTAVINFQETDSEAEFLKACNWLKADAKNAKAVWKVLTIHCPVYNTNTEAYIDWVTNNLPAAAQEAGINVVFSGHDHAYSRTKPMTDGEVDTVNGITYIICGNTGEKSYSTTINPAYHIDSFKSRAEYTATYLSVTTTDTEMLITTYDVNGTESSIIDSCTIKKQGDCVTDGHTYTYDNGYLTCSACGYKTPVGQYTGFIKNTKGGLMYFIGGNAKTGWLSLGEDHYYFGADGVAQIGEVTLNGRTYTFGADGKMTLGAFVQNKDGTHSYYINGVLQRGWFYIYDGWYYFSRTNGYKTLKGTTKVNKLTYTFDSDGKLLKGAWNKTETGTSYFWGPNPLTGLQKIEDSWYYFSPDNYYMLHDDSITIDDVVYTFGTNGKAYHIGDHACQLAFDDAVKATCTSKGLTDGCHCSVCGQVIVAQEEIPMIAHKWTGGSCTEPKVCSVCGTKDTVPGHAWKDATCTSPKTCAECGVTEGTALGHDYVRDTADSHNSASCIVYKCTRCGQLMLVAVSVPTDPTPTEPGSSEITYDKGDVNMDGNVNAADARIALRIAAKLEKPANDDVFALADMDDDKFITAADARKILRIAAKLDKA